ncbi:hypothetical protein BGZ65_000095 [Modicella reniformis]|uniref:Uncharacterized protein n=1 Tax=Modicella reniformis TaxID=1440133 RepID=A0A9P6J3C9_9FUNG|nr:hypothetical protein BGZ65_000095 [Modicella reniformis]
MSQTNKAFSGLPNIDEVRLGEKLTAAMLSSTKENMPGPIEQRLRTGPETPLPSCVDFAIYPLGTTVPFSQYIKKVEEILKQLETVSNIHIRFV